MELNLYIKFINRYHCKLTDHAKIMPSCYTVIQYIPDIIANERVNIGIIAFDDSRMEIRFVNSWGRVCQFTGRETDIEFLNAFRVFVEEMSCTDFLSSIGPNEEPKIINSQYFEKIFAPWSNNFSFSEPRGSLDEPKTLLDNIYQEFLK